MPFLSARAGYTAALLKGLDRSREIRDVFLFRSGGELLSHVLRRSTIAAAALNFRVRDGIGCFARAVATRPEKKHHRLGCCPAILVIWLLWKRHVALPFPDQIKPIGPLVPVN